MESNAVEPTTNTLTRGEVIEETAFGNVKVARRANGGLSGLEKPLQSSSLAGRERGMDFGNRQQLSAFGYVALAEPKTA